MNRAARLLCLLAVLAPAGALAQEIDLRPFDKNRNGIIDAGTDEERIYLLHKNNELYRKYDLNFNGRLDPGEIATYERAQDDALELARNDFRRKASRGELVKVEPPAIRPKTEPQATTLKAGFILRQSFEDVSIFSKPFDASNAQGATFSWSHDRVRNNRIWSARGIAAVPIVYRREFLDDEQFRTGPHFVASTFAPFLKFERVSSRTSDIQNLTFGVLSETAIANVFNSTHYYRLRGGALTDFDGDIKSWSFTGEWEPVSNVYMIGAPVPIGTLPMTATFSAKVRAIYSGAVGNSALPIYATRQEALRIGPMFTLSIQPMQIATVPDWLRRMRLMASYGHLRDIYSDRSYEIFNSSLTWNLDAQGHLGLQLAYTKGKSEDSGGDVDIVTLGLSSKF